ncbi:MAG: dTDP-4-dehydrorhamnose 3,5-epimerase family protein [Firmicutes bacterium]|nr:dTDP-4-dehydrorhamnose 3,5-epimerase family protein [Bacillota bacterium]
MRLIDGVRVKRLQVIPDERGRVMEMLRRDDDLFLGFGQAYLTTAYPGVTKAWHYHERQTDNFVVVGGMAKLVLYDEREDSPTRGLVNEFFLGVHNPLLVQVPPRVWHGFKCVSETECLAINFPTEPYDYEHPDEHRLDPHGSHIPYEWGRRDG